VGVLIIGDYTTRIGDPSAGRPERPILTDEEIDANARTYLEQAMVVLDPDRTEVRSNGEWLSKLSFADVVRLTRTITVARILERDDFAKRMAANQPVSVSELLYPLMQAYDSVAIAADVELGGTDQLYNLLTGREVMEHYGLAPQVVLTTPLLLSWDGAKMSSSVGNNIPLTAPPEEMFGRTMRIPDSLLPQWWQLVAEQEPTAADPMQSKLALARWIVARSHGEEAAGASAITEVRGDADDGRESPAVPGSADRAATSGTSSESRPRRRPGECCRRRLRPPRRASARQSSARAPASTASDRRRSAPARRRAATTGKERVGDPHRAANISSGGAVSGMLLPTDELIFAPSQERRSGVVSTTWGASP